MSFRRRHLSRRDGVGSGRKKTTSQYPWRTLRLERLESRIQPSVANYYPPSHFFVNPPATTANTPLASMAPSNIALKYLAQNAGQFGASPGDFADAIVTSQYTDNNTGMAYVYLRESVNGLEVANAEMSVAVASSGIVFSAGGGFVPGLANQVGTGTVSLKLTPEQAVRKAAQELSLPVISDPYQLSRPTGTDYQSMVSASGISLEDIPARVHYVPTADGSAELAWDLVIQTPDGHHWYNLSVADRTGSLIFLSDWIDDASYHALQLPNDSPQDGGFKVVSGVEDSKASPFGWHDTDGTTGAEFTDTRGNNVDAHLDRDGDNVADTTPPRPDGGATLDFSTFIFDASKAPSDLVNENAAVVNLFYMNNAIHDIHYKYGFTEAAGNFQFNNYGKGGVGNDAVQAQAQDNANNGSANNANMGTPPDGSSPRMQMYEFTSTTPRRDSDLDNGIIIHEYAHGVSNRLTGGPATANGLNATQSGGMGEGWGDFYGLMFLQRATDTKNDSHGMGTYAIGEPITGDGIRRRPYSYNMTLDPLTFDAYGTSGTTSYGINRSTQVHNSGELWASTLWDLNWLLIDKYGFDADLLTGWSATPGPANAGNKLMLQLVMDGLKLQPANPSFIQARDAILAADTALTGGANHFEIWTAFARRGLGKFAATSSSSATSITIDFTVPPELTWLVVQSSVPGANSTVAAPPANYVLNLSGAIDTTTLDASDLSVNGVAATTVTYTPGDLSVTFGFGTNPVTIQGVQSIKLDQAAFKQTDGKDLLAYNVVFRYDALVMQVTSTNPAVGSIITPPLTQIDINLNEAVDPGTVSNSDLVISQGTVTGFSLLNSNQTIRYTLGGSITSDIAWTASIAAGALADPFGNPNLVFNGSYTIDFVSEAFPTPMTSRQPSGSMIYDGSLTRNIAFAGDVDSYTLTVDAGQTITVLATPTGTTLQPTIAIKNPSSVVIGSATATAAGQPALVQSVTATTSGVYTIEMSGAASTTGSESIHVALNAAQEREGRFAGAGNNSPGGAQSLDSSLVTMTTGSVSASRGAVLGTTGSTNYTATTLAPTFTDISTTGTKSTSAVGDDESDTLSARNSPISASRFTAPPTRACLSTLMA